MSDLEKNLLRAGSAVLLANLIWLNILTIEIKGNVQEEIGRSEEIDTTQKERITANTNRSLLTSERVSGLVAEVGIYHK